MKKELFIYSFALLFPFALFAQTKTVVKAKVVQADALELDASGDPLTVGDISKFEIKGGTAPYSDYQWEQSDEEAGKNHKVTVEDANKCTVSIYVNVQDFTDIETIEFSQQHAYPNPTSDIVNIPISSEDRKVTISLIDANGLLLYKNSIETSGQAYPLTLSSCAPGKYFIRVVGNQTKVYSIIKK